MPFPNLEGRPSKLTPEQKLEVYKAFEEYVQEEDYPTLPGFCVHNDTAWKYDVTKQNLKDWAQFSTLIKKACAKQEEYTESEVKKGKMNPTWAIFKLKQPAFGWTDKQEHELSGGVNISSFSEDKKTEFEQWLKSQSTSTTT